MILKKDLKRIQKMLEKRDLLRDKVVEISRKATRLSDQAIIMIHRNEFERAKMNMWEAGQLLQRLQILLKHSPELRNFGTVLVAQQEYAEGKLLLNVAQYRRILPLDEAKVEPTVYVLALLDLIGELRRMALNYLRKGDGAEAEKILSVMEDTYEDLMSIDHTAIIPTFRVKSDACRRIVESTRGDVIAEVRRIALEKAVANLEKRIGSANP